MFRPNRAANRILMKPFQPDSSVVERVVPSPNIGERAGGREPDMIVLHYTGMQTGDAALERLCDPEAKVSSHYLVYENGSTVQMVPEALRASHAGVSSWEGETDTNSRSIGIEIVNPGHDFGYPAFPSRQIAAVIVLCKGILTRHTILRENIVAHSDVAPARKQDPGEKFPWKLLHDSGVGLWVEPAPITDWLSLIPGEAREAALNSFFRAHASDPLVLDKWFALQAMIPEDETLARVKRLMNHHAFSLTNPNRLRSFNYSSLVI